MPRKAATTKEEPKAVQDATPEVAKKEGVDPRDSVLENFKEFRSVPAQRMGPMDEFLRVKNLPADRVVTWATDPRIDNGQHLSLIKGLGFRAVEIDEVTTNLYDDKKMVLNQYDEGPNRMVVVGGGVLMIGYRQYRDERKAAERRQHKERVDAETGKLDDVGIKEHGTSKRADLTEVMG